MSGSLWILCPFTCMPLPMTLSLIKLPLIYETISQEGKVCLFVYMLAPWHTWVLMGPDSNKVLKPDFKAYKYAGLVVYGNNIQKQIKVKGKRRERPRPLAANQDEQFYCQPLGQEKGKTYPISNAIEVFYISLSTFVKTYVNGTFCNLSKTFIGNFLTYSATMTSLLNCDLLPTEV